MPVDLDDQLTALGAALMRGSTPIESDEAQGQSGERPDAAAVPVTLLTAPARPGRRWVKAAAMAGAAAAVVAVAAVGSSQGDDSDRAELSSVDGGALTIDDRSENAAVWMLEGADDDGWGDDDSYRFRYYTAGSASPEDEPALVVTMVDADAGFTGAPDDATTISVSGEEAWWWSTDPLTSASIAFGRDGQWYRVDGYHVSESQLLAAAEHVRPSDDGYGAVIDAAGLPSGLVEQAAGPMREAWFVSRDAFDRGIATARWTDGERPAWLSIAETDVDLVALARVGAGSVAEVDVRGVPGVMVTTELDPAFRTLVWAEGGRTYFLGVRDMGGDELLAFASALRPATGAEWASMLVASEPDPADLVPVAVDSFPVIEESLVRDEGRGPTLAQYGITWDAAGTPIAIPMIDVHGGSVTINVTPGPYAPADGEPVTIAGRSAVVWGGDGPLLDVAVELEDGSVLGLSTAVLTRDELLTVAGAVELVDRAAWEARYAPEPPTAQPAPPATIPPVTTAVPPNEPPPTSYLALAGLIAVQERLVELGFDPGPVDGVLGRQTEQAIWAAEKLYLGTPLEEVTGRASDALIAALARADGTDPRAPRRSVPDGTHVEIDLPSQVLIVYDRDQPVLVTHISTGALDEEGEPTQWCESITIDTDARGNPLPAPEEREVCGRSLTPAGVFDVDRLLPGTRVGPLGAMWNPIYFDDGMAIHGARNVPQAPVSHGAVRVPMHVSERLPDLIAPGDVVYVFDGVTEPEDVPPPTAEPGGFPEP